PLTMMSVTVSSSISGSSGPRPSMSAIRDPTSSCCSAKLSWILVSVSRSLTQPLSCASKTARGISALGCSLCRTGQQRHDLPQLPHDGTAGRGDWWRLPGIGGCTGGFGVVGKPRIERLADPLLELAFTDQSALAAGPRLDQPEPSLCRLFAHQGL